MKTQIELQYGRRSFNVAVEQSERRRLSITVHPDLRVTAKAPIEYGADTIRARLQKRVAWIASQLDYFYQFQPGTVDRMYVSGETHYFLGRQYRLRILKKQAPRVRLIGSFFELDTPDPENHERIQEQMASWYLTHAKAVLVNRLALHWPTFKRMGASEPQLNCRQMKKRWGSCNKNGRILLNTELIKAPLYCIDYVIVHELCHLFCPHHDEKFFRLLKRILPDWEARKNRLERSII